MKILNLYSGIGGNRKHWKQCDIVAVENNKEIAEIYKSLYPGDQVIVGDAHEYLLKNYNNFDIIWSSPPCQSHSQFRQNINVRRGQSSPIYPDMKLYQEIIFLQYNFKGYWIVENVKPYYQPLVKPSFKMERHLWWNNFDIVLKEFKKPNINLIKKGTVEELQKIHGIDLSDFNIKNKRQILRNCVNPEVGNYIFKQMVNCHDKKNKRRKRK